MTGGKQSGARKTKRQWDWAGDPGLIQYQKDAIRGRLRALQPGRRRHCVEALIVPREGNLESEVLVFLGRFVLCEGHGSNGHYTDCSFRTEIDGVIELQ